MNGLIVFCAKYLVFIIPLLWLVAWWQEATKRRKEMIVTSVVAGIVAIVLAKIGSKVYYDPRPFTHDKVKALFPHGADNGFPSDHSWFAMTVSAVIYFYKKQLAYIALALTLVIGVARVAAHVHSPIDIIGGFAIGIAAAYIGKWLGSEFSRSQA